MPMYVLIAYAHNPILIDIMNIPLIEFLILICFELSLQNKCFLFKKRDVS